MPLAEDDKVIVSKRELAALRRDSWVLGALENGGVDNWDDYSQSIQDACEGDPEGAREAGFGDWLDDDEDEDG